MCSFVQVGERPQHGQSLSDECANVVHSLAGQPTAQRAPTCVSQGISRKRAKCSTRFRSRSAIRLIQPHASSHARSPSNTGRSAQPIRLRGLALAEKGLQLRDAVLGVREEVRLDLLPGLDVLAHHEELLRVGTRRRRRVSRWQEPPITWSQGTPTLRWPRPTLGRTDERSPSLRCQSP